MIKEKHFHGIPIRDQMKYLGILIDDCGNAKPHLKATKLMVAGLKRQISLNWAAKLPPNLKLLSWQSLVRSKVMYHLLNLTHYFPTLKQTLVSFLYQSIKALLQYKRNPDTQLFLKTVLGETVSEYIELLVQQSRQALLPPDQKTKPALKLLHIGTRLKQMIEYKVSPVVQLLTQTLVSSTSKKHKLMCTSKVPLNDRHWP